jgi:hypothetical protein
MLRLILSSLSLCIRQCVRPFAQHGHTFDSGAHGDVCLAGSANAQGVADAPIRPRRADLGLRSAFVLGRPPRRPRRRPFPANTDELAAERMVGPVHQSRVCFREKVSFINYCRTYLFAWVGNRRTDVEPRRSHRNSNCRIPVGVTFCREIQSRSSGDGFTTTNKGWCNWCCSPEHYDE